MVMVGVGGEIASGAEPQLTIFCRVQSWISIYKLNEPHKCHFTSQWLDRQTASGLYGRNSLGALKKTRSLRQLVLLTCGKLSARASNLS